MLKVSHVTKLHWIAWSRRICKTQAARTQVCKLLGAIGAVELDAKLVGSGVERRGERSGAQCCAPVALGDLALDGLLAVGEEVEVRAIVLCSGPVR